MGTLLTHVAVSGGTIKRSSLEVLSHMRQQAEAHGYDAEAVIIDADASGYVEQVQQYGPSKVYTVEDPVFKQHRNAPFLKALSQVMDKADPYLVAFASTEGTRDILGALAARQDAAVLSDVSAFELTDSGIKATRPVMAAKILSENKAWGETILVSVRSGSYDLSVSETDAEVVNIEYSAGEDEITPILREIIETSGDKVDLTEAETIVAAGRGAKDEEGQRLVSELASVLDAGIGA